jgi:WD40 repeat protein
VPVSSAAAAISPDSRWLLNEQKNGVLAAWPLEAGPAVLRIRLDAPIRSISAEHDGWLAAGTDSGKVAVVGLDTWKERTGPRLPGPAAPVTKVTASSDGRWLVVARSTSLHVFDSRTWAEMASTTYGQVDPRARAAFDAKDRWLVAVMGTAVVVWQPDGWRERVRLEHDGEIEAVRVSPDGRQLATETRWTAGHDSGVHLTRVFDLASGRETGWEYSSGGGNISKAFMRDEAARRKRALVGGDTVSVREAAPSWPALELSEPSERVSADGRWGAGFSGSVVTLGDAAATREIGEFDHGSQITSVRFVPTRSARWLVSAAEDGTLAIWPMRTEDLAGEACARLHAIFDAQALGKLIADTRAERSCEAK